MSGLDKKGTKYPNGVDVPQSKLFINEIAVTASADDLNRLTGSLRGSATLDPASLADGAGATAVITVTGAALGDFSLVSAPYDLTDLTVTSYVQGANTVEVRIQNESGAPADLPSGTWRALVFKG